MKIVFTAVKYCRIFHGRVIIMYSGVARLTPVKNQNNLALVGFSFEPRREKTGFMHMRKQRRRSASRYREADQRLCFRYTDSTIPLLPKSEISSLCPSSVVVQPSLCRTWSETPKTGFLRTRLRYLIGFVSSILIANEILFKFCIHHCLNKH